MQQEKETAMASVAGSAVLRKVCGTPTEMAEQCLQCRGWCGTSLLRTWTGGQKVKAKTERLRGKIRLIFYFLQLLGFGTSWDLLCMSAMTIRAQ